MFQNEVFLSSFYVDCHSISSFEALFIMILVLKLPNWIDGMTDISDSIVVFATEKKVTNKNTCKTFIFKKKTT